MTIDEQRRELARRAGDGDIEAYQQLGRLLEREGRVPAHQDYNPRSKLVKFDKTPRGFAIGEFRDLYGAKCSIQDSSLATEAALWLGIDDADPKVLIPGKSWQPLTLPPDSLLKTRMHLGLGHARQLWKILGRFLDTGYVAPKRGRS